MKTRLKWTIAATLIILLYGFGVVWWWGSMPVIDPGLWNQYQMTHLEGH